mmetsp:Transcript_105107/g.240836  ORF Transcript_105107/g.240836 Transcript_105107/m.240836 type:complete len:353 (+) Transcript_105107:1686-2744(+)
MGLSWCGVPCSRLGKYTPAFTCCVPPSPFTSGNFTATSSDAGSISSRTALPEGMVSPSTTSIHPAWSLSMTWDRMQAMRVRWVTSTTATSCSAVAAYFCTLWRSIWARYLACSKDSPPWSVYSRSVHHDSNCPGKWALVSWIVSPDQSPRSMSDRSVSIWGTSPWGRAMSSAVTVDRSRGEHSTATTGSEASHSAKTFPCCTPVSDRVEFTVPALPQSRNPTHSPCLTIMAFTFPPALGASLPPDAPRCIPALGLTSGWYTVWERNMGQGTKASRGGENTGRVLGYLSRFRQKAMSCLPSGVVPMTTDVGPRRNLRSSSSIDDGASCKIRRALSSRIKLDLSATDSTRACSR